ncbi:hypothetical protein [Ralstonia edaphi]|jgi:hypothetical protein|uniref:hypothetical protein n=1 Tax=Ralstonia edaphi TaxID=3058599 RepID=UPI00292D0F5B|nr:hypothetical protein [Ralstonia sp. LMG 6871]
MTHPTLENLLRSVLSIDVGLSKSAEAVALARFLREPEVCDRLKSELLSFEASGESWIKLLDNERYCVCPTDSEAEAKDFVMDKFGRHLLGATT